MPEPESQAGHSHVCPWWFIHSFDNPLRRLIQDPMRILTGLVHEGDACVDVGCGIGYFTIPMARLVGDEGTVTAVDLQSPMLAGVERRARAADVSARIRLHQAAATTLNLEGQYDFALTFWMVHEVPDQRVLLGEIRTALRPGGSLLVVEPKGHVSGSAFNRTMEMAREVGFATAPGPRVALSRAVLMTCSDGVQRDNGIELTVGALE